MAKPPAGYEQESYKDPDEYQRPESRRRMVQGPARLCHACFRTDPRYTDTVCGRCLRELNNVKLIQAEIGQSFPKVMDMTLTAMVQALWKKVRGK